MPGLTRRQATELALGEYVLGLNDLGLGARAEQIYLRHQVREVRPLLLRQAALLKQATGSRGSGTEPEPPEPEEDDEDDEDEE